MYSTILKTFAFILLTKISHQNMYNVCRQQSDCSANHCCATRKLTGSFGFCMPARQLGEQCTPSYMYGMSFVCGCKKGLTCAVVEKGKNNVAKHRCVQILPEAMEYDEAPKRELNLKNLTRYTAKDIVRLLQLYKKPLLTRT